MTAPEPAAAPLASVVIPTRDRAGMVAEAVASALAQTWRPLEVVVVDDGSSDATPAVLAGFGDAIRVLRQEPRGCAAARNAGLAAARGALLAFLDSDDRLRPEAIARKAGVLLAPGPPAAGFAYGDVEVGEAGAAPRAVPALRAGPGESLAELLFFSTAIALPAVLFRREVVAAAGGFDERLALNEDTDLLHRVALRHAGVHVAGVDAWVRLHGGRKSGQLPDLLAAVRSSYAALLAAEPRLRAPIGARLRARFAQLDADRAIALLERGDAAAARRTLAATPDRLLRLLARGRLVERRAGRSLLHRYRHRFLRTPVAPLPGDRARARLPRGSGSPPWA